MPARFNPTGSQGFQSTNVAITSIVGNQAFCVDNFGKHYQLRTTDIVGSGSLPQAGEFWTIDRTLGRGYTFQCRTSANPPIANTSTTSLLAALVATGLIQEQLGVTGAVGESISAGYCFNSVDL